VVSIDQVFSDSTIHVLLRIKRGSGFQIDGDSFGHFWWCANWKRVFDQESPSYIVCVSGIMPESSRRIALRRSSYYFDSVAEKAAMKESLIRRGVVIGSDYLLKLSCPLPFWGMIGVIWLKTLFYFLQMQLR
jgi:hypothetical protein